MNTSHLRLFVLLLCTQLFGLATLRAQILRELTTPVADVTLTSVLASSISAQVSYGMRMTDVEYVGTNTFGNPLFDATFVQNTGAYQGGWWWYYNITSSQLSS